MFEEVVRVACMYEAVHLESTGSTTPSRFVQTAAGLEYNGVVLCNSGEPIPEDILKRLREWATIDVVHGVTIEATSRESLSQSVRSIRPRCELLRVVVTDAELAAFASEQARIDVLAVPGDIDPPLSHSTVTRSRAHGIALELNLGPILRSAGGTRVMSITTLRDRARVIEDEDCPVAISAGATRYEELRAPRELVALGTELEINSDLLESGLETWQRIAEQNRAVLDDNFIEPGVEMESNDT